MKTFTIHTRRGAALFTGLMLLLVMTLIGISTMRSTTLQEKMTGNFRESQIAFQRAENVVKQIERSLQERATTGVSGGFTLESWADAGLTLFDCSGTGILASQIDVTSGNWNPAPDGQADAWYRVFDMGAVGGQAVSCRPLIQEVCTGAGNQAQNYLVFGYARGPADRSEAVVVSSYYYPGNDDC